MVRLSLLLVCMILFVAGCESRFSLPGRQMTNEERRMRDAQLSEYAKQERRTPVRIDLPAGTTPERLDRAAAEPLVVRTFLNGYESTSRLGDVLRIERRDGIYMVNGREYVLADRSLWRVDSAD